MEWPHGRTLSTLNIWSAPAMSSATRTNPDAPRIVSANPAICADTSAPIIAESMNHVRVTSRTA